MGKDTRLVGWVRAARKVYEGFPKVVRDRVSTALTIAAEGGKADIAKPLRSLGSGVMEIAVRHRTGAWRVVYATEITGGLWVLHAFQKKSKRASKPRKQRSTSSGRVSSDCVRILHTGGRTANFGSVLEASPGDTFAKVRFLVSFSLEYRCSCREDETAESTDGRRGKRRRSSCRGGSVTERWDDTDIKTFDPLECKGFIP